jgi:hypothetical protein
MRKGNVPIRERYYSFLIYCSNSAFLSDREVWFTGKDLASLHGEGCIPAVPFTHIPVVPREVQTMDSSKYRVS